MTPTWTLTMVEFHDVWHLFTPSAIEANAMGLCMGTNTLL